jgi:hypothetical protein
MALRLENISFDCHDAEKLAEFWRDVLGWRITSIHPEEVVLQPLAGTPEEGVLPDILFLPVPEPKSAKNRVHLDVRPTDQVAEVERILNLGATRVDIGQTAECTWVVLADPEGNEFCVLRPLTDSEQEQFP